MTADHYAAAGRGWATGAELVYGPIAAKLITLSPHPLTSRNQRHEALKVIACDRPA